MLLFGASLIAQTIIYHINLPVISHNPESLDNPQFFVAKFGKIGYDKGVGMQDPHLFVISKGGLV
jgi:hypothetical protein